VPIITPWRFINRRVLELGIASREISAFQVSPLTIVISPGRGLCRAEFRSDRIDIMLSRSRLTDLLSGSLDLKMEHRGSPTPSGDPLTLTVPASLKRAGREMRMLVENAGDGSCSTG